MNYNIRRKKVHTTEDSTSSSPIIPAAHGHTASLSAANIGAEDYDYKSDTFTAVASTGVPLQKIRSKCAVNNYVVRKKSTNITNRANF